MKSHKLCDEQGLKCPVLTTTARGHPSGFKGPRCDSVDSFSSYKMGLSKNVSVKSIQRELMLLAGHNVPVMHTVPEERDTALAVQPSAQHRSLELLRTELEEQQQRFAPQRPAQELRTSPTHRLAQLRAGLELAHTELQKLQHRFAPAEELHK